LPIASGRRPGIELDFVADEAGLTFGTAKLAEGMEKVFAGPHPGTTASGEPSAIPTTDYKNVAGALVSWGVLVVTAVQRAARWARSAVSSLACSGSSWPRIRGEALRRRCSHPARTRRESTRRRANAPWWRTLR
jgi:hypothetical protein